MESSHLQLDRVRVCYPGGIEALRGVDLEVAPGQTLALVGESGSGKTTLLRLFNRMTEPSSGTVYVGGQAVHRQDPVALRRGIGYVQQEGGLMPHWTVARNVALVPRLLGTDPAEIAERVEQLLEEFGLKPALFSSRYPAELSGGQRQRVALARAMAADPAVVLLDEPFGALDALTRADAQRTFAEWQQAHRKTMLLVTHDLREAFRLADRIAVLRDGEILQCATVPELKARPREGYVAELLARAES